MSATIKAIEYYLPDDRLDNSTLNQLFPDWSVDKISAKTGIFQRHIAAKDEFTSDMAVKAAKKLFEKNDIGAESIDFILLCTQSPDYFLPTTACLIQDALGIPTSAGAFDFNLGCSGYVYGLAVSKGLISAGIAKNVLLITSETYSKFIHPEDKSNRTIFGDAASATLITQDDGFATIMDFDLGTDGRGANNLIVKRGAVRYPLDQASEDYVDEFNNVRNEKNLLMNGTEIFNFTSAMVPVLVDRVLKKNNLASGDIAMYIFHQANKFMLNHLRSKLKIPEERFYYFLENCGNTVSSTLPIALKEADNSKEFQSGDQLLLAGFGVGYSWGGCVLACE